MLPPQAARAAGANRGTPSPRPTVPSSAAEGGVLLPVWGEAPLRALGQPGTEVLGPGSPPKPPRWDLGGDGGMFPPMDVGRGPQPLALMQSER